MHAEHRKIPYKIRSILLRGCLIALAMSLASAAPGAQPSSARVLADTSATDEARLAAASTLVRNATTENDVRAINSLLSRETDGTTRRILIDAIANAPLVVDGLDEPLIGLVGLGAPADRPATLRALGSTATQRAARVLVNHAAPFMPSEVSEAAFDSLIRMTGRADLGTDHDTWREWFDSVIDLEEPEWHRELLRGLRGHADTLNRDLDSAFLATTDIYKRHFRVVPFQDRDGLLAEMLRAGGALQQLGIELLYREIASNRQIGDAVGEAAIEILASHTTETRIEAARLLATLRPREAGTRLTRALEIETEPPAAKALLAACARWPRVAAVQPALRWLEFGSETRDEAAALLFALDAEGLLTSPADRRRVAAALRSAGPAKLTPDGLRLMVLTGNELDREAIASLIDDSDASTRGAAAAALAKRPEFAGRVINAATLDPTLYPAAVTAIASHRPTPQGYAMLRQIQPPTPVAANTGLLAVARSMTLPDLLEAAETHESDPEMRVAILSTVGTAAASPAERELINRTKLLLAETQLELEHPEPALASLAQVVSSDDATTSRVTELRVTSLLWLNRIEEASALETGAETWLRAIDRFADEPHAPQIANATLARFEGVLQQEERERLSAIVQIAESGTDSEQTGG